MPFPSIILQEPQVLLREHQLEEIARAYHKMKMLGLKPKRTFAAVANQLGFTSVEANKISNRMLLRLRRIGVPSAAEELLSPCHRRGHEEVAA